MRLQGFQGLGSRGARMWCLLLLHQGCSRLEPSTGAYITYIFGGFLNYKYSITALGPFLAKPGS